MLRRSRALLAALSLLCFLAIAPKLNNYPDEGPLPLAIQGPIDAHFEIAWMRNKLLLSGHTVSNQHERELGDLATASFPGKTVKTKFEPLAIVPRYWKDVSLQVLYTLAETSSAQAELAPGNLRISAVIVDEISWQARISALLHILPKSITVSQDTIVINNKRAPADICRTLLKEFSAGDINFEMSSPVFQSSAIPRLERVTAVAAVCSDALIQITGHTDASGSESWNKHLSVSRAEAVANYMQENGIGRERLQVIGAGSSVAIANNETYYGRGLNRRIEIVFTIPTP